MNDILAGKLASQFHLSEKRRFKITVGMAMLFMIMACGENPTSPDETTDDGVIFYTYRVVASHPHDRSAFTQGLVWDDGVLYEGTGLNGQSELRQVSLTSGEVVRKTSLSPQYFGEGIAVVGDEIIQLTLQSQVAFLYSKESFEMTREFGYTTEGWGVTYDGEFLIMSDGTATLYFRDPETFTEIRTVEVTYEGEPVSNLNELEYVNGDVYANVWHTDRIAIISPDSGDVTGWIDLSGLLSTEDRREPVDVLNGIAYDASRDRLWVTGKFWPKLFEIDLIKK